MSSGPVRVYLGIGSNIDPEIYIPKALVALEAQFGEISCSSFYQNKSLGFDGPDFINLAVSFSSTADFLKLDEHLKTIEVSCGRDRSREKGKGSRTLDLDLLLFGAMEGEVHGCVLPRPEIYEHQFVWQPLLEIFETSHRLSAFEIKIKSQLDQLTKEASLLPRRNWPRKDLLP